MDRLLVAVAIVVVASCVAVVLRRRATVDAPTQATHATPAQLDRNDFDRPDAPWLIAVFTSASCHTCADTLTKAHVLSSRSVAVEEIEFSADRDRHRRYAIDTVPMVVVADSAGVVRAAFVGRVTAADLWAAVADARTAD